MFYKAVLLAALLAGVQAGDNTTATEGNRTSDDVMQAEMKLRKVLLKDYKKTVMPAINTTVTIIDIGIQRITMHESDSVMGVFIELAMLWADPRLVWDLASHVKVGILGMDPDDIWTPDLVVYNGASLGHVPKSVLPMIVYPKAGTVLYTSPFDLQFSCVMDLTYWPHDSHNCTLKLGTWVHQGHMLDLFLKNNTIEIKIPSGVTSSGQDLSVSEWGIIGTSVSREEEHYPCCQEPQVTIHMTIRVKRNAPVYAWTIKVPVACLSFLTVLLFLLPPAAAEKLIFGALCLIANLVYIAYTSSVIRQSPSHTPLIIGLVSQQVLLVTLSIAVAAFTVRLARDPQSKGLPSIVKKVLVIVSFPLCLGSYRSLIIYSSHTFEFSAKPDSLDLEDETGSYQQRRRLSMDGCEWLFLSAVLDRMALLLYVTIFIISLMRYSYVL